MIAVKQEVASVVDTAGSKVARLEEHGPIIEQISVNCKDGHIFRSIFGTQKAGWREMRR